MVGPCSSCGPFTQYCGHQSNSFSSMFWSQYHNSSYDDDGADHYIYSSSSSSSSSSSYSPSVDCTLSLGTPSTRLSTTENINYDQQQPPKHTPHRNSVSSFCWDLLHPSSTKQQHQPSSKPPRSSTNSASDSLLARRCANCDTTSTPLWRNGPRGPKSLCNACGIRFKKEERRAAAATTTAAPHNGGPAAGLMDPNNGYYNGSWGTHPYGSTNSQKMQSFGAPNEFRFIEDDQSGSEAGIQFLSWLTHDRSSGLVHDFTR